MRKRIISSFNFNSWKPVSKISYRKKIQKFAEFVREKYSDTAVLAIQEFITQGGKYIDELYEAFGKEYYVVTPPSFDYQMHARSLVSITLLRKSAVDRYEVKDLGRCLPNRISYSVVWIDGKPWSIMNIYAVQIANFSGKADWYIAQRQELHEELWEEILAECKRQCEGRVIVLGDFQESSKGAHIKELNNSGYKELALEFTAEWNIDHIIFSKKAWSDFNPSVLNGDLIDELSDHCLLAVMSAQAEKVSLLRDILRYFATVAFHNKEIFISDGHIGVDGNRIRILEGAIKKYGGGDIVLTSDWKHVRIGDDLDYLREKLMEYGLEISAMTEDHWNNRGQGIKDYLDEHPEIDEYVILDDNRFDFEDFPKLWERLLLTDGIENAAFASKTPAVETILFCEYIKEFSQFDEIRLQDDKSDVNSPKSKKVKPPDGDWQLIKAEIVDAVYDRATLAACYKIEQMIPEELEQLIIQTWDKCRIQKRQEIMLKDFRILIDKLQYSHHSDVTSEDVEREFELEIGGRRAWDATPYEISEELCTENHMTKQKCMEKARMIMASDDFCEEIDRIYSKENMKKYYGHPVHYLISAGDFGAAKDMIDILIPALLKNKRLLGGRKMFLSKIKGEADRDERFENVFSSSSGATVVVKMPERSDLGDMATDLTRIMEITGRMLEKYGNDTLFIFVDVSGKSIVTSKAIKTLLTYADMVHLTEGSGSYQKAVRYLDKLAKKTDYQDYKIEDITSYLSEKESYSVSDIFEAYNRWYASGLKSHVYKAYREIDTYKIKCTKREDKPYETLMKLVGLTEVKKVVNQILDLARVSNIRKLMGYKESSNSLHMLFYGNPGTAKTTVARLLAQVLKEEGVLANGHLVECGRQDLVGRYVGWTAKVVEEKFRAARGGVLFIDEAYSLVDDSNTYGAEAINTIVQQMENYRDEVIVIFAGYPDKMKTFLEQNEGLNSRIAFHLDFPDYTGEELTDILDLMLEKKGYKMDGEAREKCLSICSQACKYENFGNGRFVRNLLEQAAMRQASRILKEYQDDDITKEIASGIIAEDIRMPHMANRNEGRRMGFV